MAESLPCSSETKMLKAIKKKKKRHVYVTLSPGGQKWCFTQSCVPRVGTVTDRDTDISVGCELVKDADVTK